MRSLREIFVSFYAQNDVIARISGNSDWRKIRSGLFFGPKSPDSCLERDRQKQAEADSGLPIRVFCGGNAPNGYFYVGYRL